MARKRPKELPNILKEVVEVELHSPVVGRNHDGTCKRMQITRDRFESDGNEFQMKIIRIVKPAGITLKEFAKRGGKPLVVNQPSVALQNRQRFEENIEAAPAIDPNLMYPPQNDPMYPNQQAQQQVQQPVQNDPMYPGQNIPMSQSIPVPPLTAEDLGVDTIVDMSAPVEEEAPMDDIVYAEDMPQEVTTEELPPAEVTPEAGAVSEDLNPSTMSYQQLKDTCVLRGIEFKGNASRAVLEDLLN